MKIVELKQVPIEEDDPRGWWVRNRDSLRRLRRFARECGATVYGDDMPATTMERYRLELEARGQTPTPSEVFALGGSIDALRSPALAAVAAHGWYLFRHRPRGLVARALEHVTPVRLAMAIRAWDPEPLQPASTELELRGYRRRLREMDKRLRHLRAASVDEPAEVISFGASCAIERTPQGMIEEAIRVLARQRASFAEWIEYRARLALSTMLAEAAILGASPRDRLPPMIEHQIA